MSPNEEPSVHKAVPMAKKSIVRLTDAERRVCEAVVSELKGASQKARRARILWKADADGPGWTDENICESIDWQFQTADARTKLKRLYPKIKT